MALNLHKDGFMFSEVVAVLMDLFKVDPEKRSTFVSRLQQLQKVGIPAGANVGKGSKVRYVNWQLADLVLALDLIDTGLMPGSLENNPAASAYAAVGYGVLVQDSLADDKPDLFWLISPNSLAYLRSAKVAADRPNPLDTLLKGRNAENVIDALSEGPSIAINMTKRLRELRAAIEKVHPDLLAEIEFYPTRSQQREN